MHLACGTDNGTERGVGDLPAGHDIRPSAEKVLRPDIVRQLNTTLPMVIGVKERRAINVQLELTSSRVLHFLSGLLSATSSDCIERTFFLMDIGSLLELLNYYNDRKGRVSCQIQRRHEHE